MDVREIIVELQPYIPSAPVTTDNAHKQACSNDQITIDKWFDIWLSNIRENKKMFESFKKFSIGKLHNNFNLKPCIIAGSGPSLARSVSILGDRPEGVGLISCLHNFHYMEDHNANVDYYVSLDAGDITIEEVCEGGKRTEKEYWDLTKNRTLICYIGSSPELLRKWQGDIYFFNAPVPHLKFKDEVTKIEPFHCYVESGGNVFGASLMITKGFLGSNTSIFIGADFSFSNEQKRSFHAWNSKYDKTLGNCMRAVDIFGNTVLTWGSYYNFKLWFDVVAQRVPGLYINASDAGIMGAYREGNIMQIKQMKLQDVYDMLTVHRHKIEVSKEPENEKNVKILL